MTWSALDIFVVVLFTAQLVGWGCVAGALLRIKNGPVARTITRTLPLIEQGKRLAARGTDVAARLKARTLILLHRIQSIRQSAHVMDAPEGMWIEPRHVKQALGLVSLARQKQRRAPAKKRTPLAQTLGLVPPALVRLAPLGRVARVALQALKQLRR